MVLFDNTDNYFSENSTLCHETFSQLLSYINRKWDKIRNYFQVKIFIANNPYPVKEVDSTFCMNLKQSNWIPTKCIEYNYNEQIKEITETKTIKLKKPSNVFIQNANMYTNTFIHYFPYIENTRLDNALISKLNINNNIEPLDVILRLLEYISNTKYVSLSNIHLSYTNEENKRKKINTLLDNPPRSGFRRQFIERISTMNRLYDFLYDELIDDKRYTKWPLIFVPDSSVTDDTQLCVGHFLFLNEVAWEDPTNLLSEHYCIKKLYPNLERFFSNALQIPERPDVKSYMALLETYSEKNLTADQITDDVWKIIENLSDKDQDNVISKGPIELTFKHSK